MYKVSFGQRWGFGWWSNQIELIFNPIETSNPSDSRWFELAISSMNEIVRNICETLCSNVKHFFGHFFCFASANSIHCMVRQNRHQMWMVGRWMYEVCNFFYYNPSSNTIIVEKWISEKKAQGILKLKKTRKDDAVITTLTHTSYAQQYSYTHDVSASRRERERETIKPNQVWRCTAIISDIYALTFIGAFIKSE